MNRINAIRLTAILALLVCTVAAQAQRRNTRYVEYIEKYAPLAVQQMKEHKIPASITRHKGFLKVVPDRVHWHAKVIIISALNAVVTGVDVRCVMMMMPAMNVFVHTAIPGILMKITPLF